MPERGGPSPILRGPLEQDVSPLELLFDLNPRHSFSLDERDPEPIVVPERLQEVVAMRSAPGLLQKR